MGDQCGGATKILAPHIVCSEVVIPCRKPEINRPLIVCDIREIQVCIGFIKHINIDPFKRLAHVGHHQFCHTFIYGDGLVIPVEFVGPVLACQIISPHFEFFFRQIKDYLALIVRLLKLI